MNPTLQAKDISIDPSLMASLGMIGAGGKNSISDAYKRVRSGFGVKPGGYADSRLATGENFSNLGLESALGGVLGGTAYKDTLGERDFGTNYDLAKQIGELNQPSTLEEVLGGLGGGAQTGGQFAGLYNSFKKPQRTKTAVPTTSANDLYGSGLA